ncbi:MAG TPA: PAS domain S-box protein, partial [Candidatus Binataceae bacterium]|nr:PAS domain S-box protein [Candidatus Binataceae bacterium]
MRGSRAARRGRVGSGEAGAAEAGAAEAGAALGWGNERAMVRVLRASAGIVLVFQLLYLGADWSWIDERHAWVLPLHAFNLVTALLFFGLTYLRKARERVEQVIFGGCTLNFAATTALSLLTGNHEALTFALTMTLMGTAALVPWNWRWQAALELTSVGALAISTLLRPAGDLHLAYDWLALLAAIGIAQYVILSNERYRREIAHRIGALEINHRELLVESVAREAAAAVSQRMHLQLEESESKLRKIFETSNDAISIHRLSDGVYLDINHGFALTGYSRGETLGQTAASLGIWADPAQLGSLLRKLKAEGRVTNQEMDLRTKSGVVRFYLASATIVELNGEPCVIAIGRDITAIKQTERHLLVARETMRAQIETLERTENHLRAEGLERTRAMEEREAALRSLADSESKLRTIFETTTDAITISRASDGRYIDLNGGFDALGYSREEA